MSKSLVIVESPAKAKTISKYLGSDFRVESSVGHIRDLPRSSQKQPRKASPKFTSIEEKEKYKKQIERERVIRRMGVNPDNNWAARFEIIPEKEKVIKQLKKASKDVETIFLATDLDREGEAIAWHLREALGKNKFEYKRVRFNEITRTSILKSFEDPKEIDQNLVDAQQARRFLDRVVGFELSPLLWKKIARGLSAGRVQSVALRLLAEREKLISQFKPEEYWEISTEVHDHNNNPINFKLKRKKSDPLLSEIDAKNIESSINASELKITEITKKPTTVRPRAPFITSTLQQAASSRLGFGVSRTMRVAQKLYEAGRITYMRTDAPSLSNDSIEDARNYITSNFDSKYLTEKPRIYSSKENAQEAHEAIRPTSASLSPELLKGHTEEEQKLYDLIWRQFISCQMPDAKYLSINAFIDVKDFRLFAKGREVVFDGYTKVQKVNIKDEENLPILEENQVLKLNKVINEKKYTKPPSRFSEAALVKELESKGIGRPSTYANIISNIEDKGYVTLENKRFFVNKIGLIVSERLLESFEDIMNYDFTANLEVELDKIANGELEWRSVLNKFYHSFRDDLENANMDDGMRPNKPTPISLVCPQCEKDNLMIRNSSNGVFLGCQGYNNAKEEQCKKTLNLISGEEAVSIDDQQEASNLFIKKRCKICDLSMDNYLIDEYKKIHVCSGNPDCSGFEIEEGVFKIRGYDGPTLECHKCGSEMQLKTGRFGKYFACQNDNCGTTRQLMRNGEPKPIFMDPIDTGIPCQKVEDIYLLRDSLKGLFLAASKFPKNRETRAVTASELCSIVEIQEHLPTKHHFLLSAPTTDNEVPLIIRYNKSADTHYLSAEKDGKKTGITFSFQSGKWIRKEK